YEDALTSFQTAFAIEEPMAKSDPQNADWQRGLSVLHERIGDVMMAQHRPEEALASFQASLAIREVIARGDPANVRWQGDLALAYERVGSVFAALQRSAEAEAAYQRSFDIYASLLARSPDNAGLLFGSAMPLIRLGMLHGTEGAPYYEKAL